jgi:hypothetical protein
MSQKTASSSKPKSPNAKDKKMTEIDSQFNAIAREIVGSEDEFGALTTPTFDQDYPLIRAAEDDMRTYEQEAITSLAYDPAFEHAVDILFGEAGLDFDLNIFLRTVNESAREFGVSGEGVVKALAICINNKLKGQKYKTLEEFDGEA